MITRQSRSIFSLLFYTFLVYFLAGCSSQNIITREESFNSTITRIDSLFNVDMFDHAHWGVLIKSLDSGQRWYEKNPQKVFMPASNEKIITSAAALLHLGPEFRFETKLSYRGEIKDSILNGDLPIMVRMGFR